MLKRTIFFVLFFPISVSAGTTEVFPGDFDPAPENNTILSAFLYKRELAGYYVNGKKVFGGGKVSAHAKVIGITHFYQTLDLTSSATLLLPHISAHQTDGFLPPSLGTSFSGIADPRVIYTIWPVNNNERTIALSGTLFVPIGQYDETQVINAGDKRWKASLQIGWVEQLTPSLKLDVVPEINIYGKNKEYLGYVMTQEPTLAITSFLRWRAASWLETQVGIQANQFGEQTVDTQPQNNTSHTQRLFVGVTSGFSKNLIVGLKYSKDTNADFEFKTTSDLVLKLHYIY